jgi:hypothetical protein
MALCDRFLFPISYNLIFSQQDIEKALKEKERDFLKQMLFESDNEAVVATKNEALVAVKFILADQLQSLLEKERNKLEVELNKYEAKVAATRATMEKDDWDHACRFIATHDNKTINDLNKHLFPSIFKRFLQAWRT